MNLQEKLERMATTAFERQLLRHWLEGSAADAPPTHEAPTEAAPTEAANADEATPEPPLATGTHGS